jgi:hypothetical protein
LGGRFGRSFWEDVLGGRFRRTFWEDVLAGRFRRTFWEVVLGGRFGRAFWEDQVTFERSKAWGLGGTPIKNTTLKEESYVSPPGNFLFAALI